MAEKMCNLKKSGGGGKNSAGATLVGSYTSSNNVNIDISSFNNATLDNFIIEITGGGEGSSPSLTYNPCFGYVSNTVIGKRIDNKTLYVSIYHTVQSAYTDRRSTIFNFKFNVWYVAKKNT